MERGFRAFKIEPSAGDTTKPRRGILSTEQRVSTFDWSRNEYVDEILLMSGAKLRGKTLRLLDTHSTDSIKDVVGSFRDIQTQPAGTRGIPYPFIDGELVFADTVAGREAKELIEGGHVTEMSVGYRYEESDKTFIEEGERQEIEGVEHEGKVNVRTSWECQEASVVPVAADNLALIRSLNNFADNKNRKPIFEETQSDREGLTSEAVSVNDKTEAKVQSEKPTTKTITLTHNHMENNNEEANTSRDNSAKETAAAVKSHKDTLDKRAEAIFAAAEEIGDTDWGFKQFRSGKSVEEVQREAIAKLKESNVSVGHSVDEEPIGLDKKESKTYSITRAIRALMNGRKVDGLEGEVSDVIAKRTGRETDGFFVASKRELTAAGSGDEGSELVGTDHLGDSFIDVLRPNMIAGNLVRTLSGLVGDVSIPRKTAGSSASWAADETTAHATSDPTLDNVTLSPNSLGCYTDVSRQLLHQSSPDAEQMVRDDLNQALAVGIDAAILAGAGSTQPTGVDGNVAETVTVTSAAAPDKAELFEFVQNIDTGNALFGDLAWITTPALASYLKQTLIDASVSGAMWDYTNNTILGYAAHSTSQASSNDIFFGNWSEGYVLGLWSGLSISLDPYSGIKQRIVTIVADALVDGQVRNTKALTTNA
mgnify:CR=1 FL=1